MVKNAIKVYARLKPLKERKTVTNYKVYHRPEENVEEDFLYLVAPTQKSKEYPDNRPESWHFSFFRIFEESATQKHVFENVARPVLESSLDGYNGTIFAYGQTASGKTYSITGKESSIDDRGIAPRCLEYLFDVVRKRPENVYSIEVAYLEIYNENGYDLLDGNRKELRDTAITRLEDLPRVVIQEDDVGQLHLKNLTFHCVESVEDAMELLLVGNDNRITMETPMNLQSSRSHCIFTIVVSTKQFGVEQYKRAKVHLVDLAGSERVYKYSISGTTLTEAKHINLSLHYLEQVIVCLGQESVGHVPYRNSYLTSILRDSLGGNCLTTMLATLNVDVNNFEETVSTCKFAQRVAMIMNDVKMVLERNIDSENTLLKLENERLKREIKAMTKQMSFEDLTAEDKRNLDSQIRCFLESNAEIHWECNPKKIRYCFDSLKKTFELSRDPNGCLKKIEYYRNLVVQRDKEISLLIDLVKKEREKKELRKEGKKGTTKEDSCDDLRTIEVSVESSLISIGNQSSRRGNSEDGAGNIENVTVKDTRSMVHDKKGNSAFSRVSSKKGKRKAEIPKSIFQNRVDDRSPDIAIRDQEKDDRRKANCSQRSSLEDPSMAKSISMAVPCNVLNLTLNDSSEGKDKETRQRTSQRSFRNFEKKQVKSREIQTCVEKNNNTSHSARLGDEIVLQNDNDSSIGSRKDKIAIEEAKLRSEDKDHSVQSYQRLLNFNVPEHLEKSSGEDLIQNPRISSRLDTDNNLTSKRNTDLLEAKKLYNDAKRSDETYNGKSKRIEERRSVTSSKSERSENTFTLDRKSEGDKGNISFQNSLPLTGDPEIDEEIIAFYKAKRTGGVY